MRIPGINALFHDPAAAGRPRAAATWHRPAGEWRHRHTPAWPEEVAR